MSGECNNCETRQRLGRDPRCLVCIYFNAAIFNTGIPNTTVEHQETKVEKVINDAKELRRKLKINNESTEVKDVKKVIDSINYSKSFTQICKDKSKHWKELGLDIEEVFAIKEDTINDIDNAEEVKDWYYFIFPSANKLRSKYVRIYGTKISTRSVIERKCPDLDYIQYDSKKWTTPAKYTNRKPCDCYTEWML